MEYIQYIKWIDEKVTKYKFYSLSKEEIIEMLKQDVHDRDVLLSTWLVNEKGKVLAYFEKNTQLIKGEKELKKATKEEVLDEIYYQVSTTRHDIEQVLELLEEEGYIEFKKEPKEYKVFIKIITINGEKKKFYYVSSYHLSENIEEAKRFGTNEDKDGYIPEIVKESSNEL